MRVGSEDLEIIGVVADSDQGGSNGPRARACNPLHTAPYPRFLENLRGQQRDPVEIYDYN